MKRIPYKTDQNNPSIVAYKKAVEEGKRNYHVFFMSGRWIVKKLLTEKINYISDNQKEAIEYAKSVAIFDKTALFIYGTDGMIKDREYYN